MRKLSLALVAAALLALALSAMNPAGAQNCPKGKNWDDSTYSCK